MECIRRFFRRRFRYESSLYPRFRTIKAEKEKHAAGDGDGGGDEWHLDLVVCASGYDAGEQKVLEEVRARGRVAPAPSFLLRSLFCAWLARLLPASWRVC